MSRKMGLLILIGALDSWKMLVPSLYKNPPCFNQAQHKQSQRLFEQTIGENLGLEILGLSNPIDRPRLVDLYIMHVTNA